MKFAVVGMPRSRTAWLSVFLSHDGNYCYHEAMSGCTSLWDYNSRVDGCGDSGTGLMLLPPVDAPTVIIERELEPVIRFCEETYGEDLYEHLLMLKKRMDKMDGLRIPFDQIDYRLEEIWDYLIGTPYDTGRGNALKALNIQVTDPHSMVVEDSFIRELQAIQQDMRWTPSFESETNPAFAS